MNRLTRAAIVALLGSTSPAGFVAAASAQEIDEIVVRGVNIPDEKRATSEISSVLDEATFQRTGDDDIAAALARVTGLSLSQGKFIIVRGLNERYSNVTINGSPLPSPEPLQRVAPLDIIPTSVLSGSLVQKTYSPEFSAEFGGGLIELRTKGAPAEPFLEIGGSIGLDTVTTAKDGLTYDGGKRDWLGFDDGTRNTPPLLAGAFATGNFGVLQNQIDQSLNHNETLLISEAAIAPNYGVNVAGGHLIDVSDSITVGATVALGLSNDWRTREGRREQGLIASGNFGPEGAVADFTSTSNVAETSGIATIGVELGDNHELTFTNLMLRSTVKEARVNDGLDANCGCIFQISNTEFFERQVWQTQVRGDHVFGGLAIDWRFAYGEAFRDSPYQRTTTYQRADLPGSVLAYDFNRVVGNLPNTVQFSKLEDENIDAGIDVQLPFNLFENEHTLKFGYSYLEKDRDTLLRLFQYQGVNQPALAASRIDLIYSNPVLGLSRAAGGIDLALVSGQQFHDNTDSQLQTSAFYAGFDFELGPYVRLAAGGRYEDATESTASFATAFPGTSFTKSRIDEDNWLPAVTITWNPSGDLQLRGGFSQTVTRPQFRELGPAFFIDEDTDLLTIGNPFLINSQIDNYDVRAEYYFSRGQFITIGGFYKNITNPIEDAFRLESGGLLLSTFINSPSAKLYGFEFEFEKNFILADLVDWSFVDAKDLVIRTNYTYTQSEVSADGTVTLGTVDPITQRFIPSPQPANRYVTEGRPLQGQSDHIFNLQLGVEDVELNSRATILVNWASKRIRNVESFLSGVTAPAVIERPPVTLDFVFSRSFERWGGQWEIGMKVRNILGDDYEATQEFTDGSVALFDTYKLGREFSMSLKREF